VCHFVSSFLFTKVGEVHTVIEVAMANRQDVSTMSTMLSAVPGVTDQELVKRYVFCRVRDVLRDHPEQLLLLCRMF
jgi:hypothetical protein